MNRSRALAILGLIASLMGFQCAGCIPARPTGDSNELRGTITISGAWALYPMVIRWAEEFRGQHPGVEFDISAGGAGKGMADVLAGAVDIGMVSREIYPEEVEQGAYWVGVTRDAVVATLNAQNPYLEELRAKGIPPATLRGIWTGVVATWGDVLGDGAIQDPIHVYTRSDSCGAAETWAAFLGGLHQEDLQGIAVYGDPGLAEAVAQDALGIGFNNLNFAYGSETEQPISGLAIAPIDLNGNGTLDESESFYASRGELLSAVAEGQYPAPPARALNLVTLGEPGGLVREFLVWVLTEGQAWTEESGYIRLSYGEAQRELAKLE